MRRIQFYLSLLGCVSALTGAFLLLAASFPMLTHPQWDSLPERAIYVGSDSCFTCHVEQQSTWSNPLNRRLIDDVVINPHAVAMTLPTDAEAVPVGAEQNTLTVRTLDTRADISFPTAYRFADQYPSTLTLSGRVEEQLP